MSIAELLTQDAIDEGVNASSKRHVLHAVAELASRCLGVDVQICLDALNERERQGSTGVGFGVAVPHARLPGLKQMRAVFIRLETPVDFESLDEQPVDLVFGLFAPEDAGAEHLRALARVARTLRNSALRDRLRQARTEDALYTLLAMPAESDAA